ncbi:hypothetical protein XR12_23755 [Salmonella enterica]|nr:hypothetical protein [Salmonella enterica]
MRAPLKAPQAPPRVSKIETHSAKRERASVATKRVNQGSEVSAWCGCELVDGVGTIAWVLSDAAA